MHFKRNLHTLDRVIRLIVGLGCIYFGFIDTTLIGNVLAATLVGIFGVVNLFASVVSYCPVYGVTGISTYRSKDRNDD
jgi:hypothetical protein